MSISENQKLEDFSILEKIVNNQLDMKDVDYDTKIRLIELCDDRIRAIKNKIDCIDRKLQNIRKRRQTGG